MTHPPSPRRRLATVRPRFALVAMAVVLAAGMYLRVWHLRQPFVDAFSWRQASTAMMAENFYRTNPNILLPEVNWSGPGPNYQGREFQTVTYLASIVYRVLGQHDWIGRGIAVTFGLWGICALFLLTRRVWDEAHAVVVAATMAVLPGSIFVDRSFLPDPAMVALATTSVWLFVVWLQTGRRGSLGLAAVVGAWAFATKIPGLIVGLPMAYAGIATLGVRGVLRRQTLGALGAFAAIVLVPVVAWYLWARHVALSYPPYHFAGEGNWVWNQGLQRWLAQHYFLPKLGQHIGIWLWTPVFGILIAIGLVIGVVRPPAAPPAGPPEERGRETSRRAPYLFHWWLAAGIVYYAIGARELVDNPWNLHIVNPAAAALAGLSVLSIARGLARLLRSRSAVPAWSAVVLILALASWSSRESLLVMYRGFAKQGHELGLALERVSKPGDLVLTMASALGDPTPIYYSRRRGWIFPPARDGKSWGKLPDDDAESIALFDGLRRQGARWLGITRDQVRELERHPRLAEHFRRSSGPPIEAESFVIYPIAAPGGAH